MILDGHAIDVFPSRFANRLETGEKSAQIVPSPPQYRSPTLYVFTSIKVAGGNERAAPCCVSCQEQGEIVVYVHVDMTFGQTHNLLHVLIAAEGMRGQTSAINVGQGTGRKEQLKISR